MTDTPVPSDSTGDLQFQTSEPSDAPGSAPAHACALCHQQVDGEYYALGDNLVCPACAAQVQAPLTGSRAVRLAKATLYGAGAGLLGAIIWYAIRRVTNLEIGLVAIVVGIMVGTAVRKGSAGLGGRGYQLLAVAITYCSIAANYMPDIFEALMANAHAQRTAIARDADQPAAGAGIGESPDATVAMLVEAFVLAMTYPFLDAAGNLIGLLIIGFALWEAWKFNAHRPLPISGPYQLGAGPEPQPAA